MLPVTIRRLLEWDTSTVVLMHVSVASILGFLHPTQSLPLSQNTDIVQKVTIFRLMTGAYMAENFAYKQFPIYFVEGNFPKYRLSSTEF